MGFCVIPLDYLVKSGQINNPQMVTHLITIQAHDCLTLLILPFTLTALTFGSCWYYALLRYLTWGSYYPFVKRVKVNPSLKWITFAQYQHEPKVKAVRVNGRIN